MNTPPKRTKNNSGTTTRTNTTKQEKAREACVRAKAWAQKRAAQKENIKKQNLPFNTMETYFAPVAAIRVDASPPSFAAARSRMDNIDAGAVVAAETEKNKEQNNNKNDEMNDEMNESFHDAHAHEEDMMIFCDGHPESRREVKQRLTRMMLDEKQNTEDYWELYVESNYRYIALEEQLINIINEEKII